MCQLVSLVKPLLPLMFLVIFLGVLGYLCAIFLTIFAGYGILHEIFEILKLNMDASRETFVLSCTPGMIAATLVILAVLRGILHYGELNSFILDSLRGLDETIQ